MSQLIQRNDSFAISCDRGEFDVLSVQCEGAHFVIEPSTMMRSPSKANLLLVSTCLMPVVVP